MQRRMSAETRDKLMVAHCDESRRGNGLSSVCRALELHEAVHLPWIATGSHVSGLLLRLRKAGFGTFSTRLRVDPIDGTPDGIDVIRLAYGTRSGEY